MRRAPSRRCIPHRFVILSANIHYTTSIYEP